ncbi:MAG: hypothetical protein DRJ01_00390 [Bacteroidetes bacterium]|nr:MAG: hypothetical protein DRJ01_00390 [Bacteroidota bacterium]
MKHEEIINASDRLEEAISKLEVMTRKIESTEAPVNDSENAKNEASLSLADFLNSQPDVLCKYTDAIYDIKNRLELALFSVDIMEITANKA